MAEVLRTAEFLVLPVNWKMSGNWMREIPVRSLTIPHGDAAVKPSSGFFCEFFRSSPDAGDRENPCRRAAPKGRNRRAWGNAPGIRAETPASSEGAEWCGDFAPSGLPSLTPDHTSGLRSLTPNHTGKVENREGELQEAVSKRWGRHSCLPAGRQECLPHQKPRSFAVGSETASIELHVDNGSRRCVEEILR